MTQLLTPKKPEEAIAYYSDFGPILGDDWITSYTLTVSSGTVAITEEEHGRQFVRFVVSGGVDGEEATFDLHIETDGGQKIDREIALTILDAASALAPATLTKRTVVNMAFEEIGLAGYEFDATPEEQFSALRRLDALMAEWKTSSLDIGYNFPTVMGQGDLDDEAYIPDSSLNTVAIYLALRIMPAIGKTMSAETRLALSQGMSALRTACAVIPNRRLPANTPVGSGNKSRSTWAPFAGGCR